ncbi:hypothetical protein JTB14_035290 [Gonioctena quinquepunctata]|nr:hypothetical protein JTB14_035290 [Gonioctena quinquepunctata]
MYEEDSITDNMAIDSECEGDSDGEDNMPESMNRSSKSISLRSSTKSSPLTLEQDQQFSSDPEQKQDSKHVLFHTSSSDLAPVPSPEILNMPSTSTQNTSFSRFKRHQRKQTLTYQNFSEDSDDSVADPDYEEENESKRKKFFLLKIWIPKAAK